MIKLIAMIFAVSCMVGIAFYAGGTIGRDFIDRGNNYLLRNFRRFFGAKTVGDPIYPIMTISQKQSTDSAIKLSFVGDLILLREAVERARVKSEGYDFTPMFKYVKPYFDSSDYVFGVFEGPMAGHDRPYSTSNYQDGIPLHNNFPDSYATAVKDAGVDFVTTANNHLLDCGVDGAMRTLDVLDAVGLGHTGSYRNKEEHDAVKIVKVKGKRIAVLAYTYGSEYCNEDYFFKKNQNITRLLVPKKSPYFNQCKKMVEADFAAAKAYKADLIVVMPHMGADFVHEPNEKQRFWARYYVEQGADIVFADHPHAVQPIEWLDNPRGNKSLVVYCPGNFINSYTKRDGDASMIVEAYLDPDSCRPFAVSIVPIFAYGKHDENYVAVPVYDFVNRAELAPDKISISDWKRCAEVNHIVVKSALGVSLSIDNVQDRYYYFCDSGYCRQPVKGLAISDLPEHGVLVDAIKAANKVCFVGDSVTEGTKNGGYGWFEPLMQCFPDKQVSRVAKGSQGVKYFARHIDEIVAACADLYVIAVGCNDIRYRDASVCAMTPEEYVANVEETVKKIKTHNQSSRIVFVAPWESLEFDPWCKLSMSDKAELYGEYNRCLALFCEKNDCGFVDPNPFVREVLATHRPYEFLRDHIHPNADDGIKLYSKACAEYK